MKPIFISLIAFASFLLSCKTEENNIVCSGVIERSVLNVAFYDRDSTDLHSISVDTVLVIIGQDTLANATEADNISFRLSPFEQEISFTTLLDSMDAVPATLSLKYDYSSEFISNDCGYAHRFSLREASIDNGDSIVINSNIVSVFENEEEHIHIFR